MIKKIIIKLVTIFRLPLCTIGIILAVPTTLFPLYMPDVYENITMVIGYVLLVLAVIGTMNHKYNNRIENYAKNMYK